MTNQIITIEQCTLTRAEDDAWENLRALIQVAVPGMGTIFYGMLSHGEKRAVFTETVPVAATDSVSLMINPRTLFKNYDPGEQLFIVGWHEITHAMLKHPELFHQLDIMGQVPYGSYNLPWSNELGQWAADYVVNAMGVEAKVGKLPKNALYDTNIATPYSTVFDAYKKLYERLPPILRRPPPPGPTGPGPIGTQPGNQPGNQPPQPGNQPTPPQGGSQTAPTPQPGNPQPQPPSAPVQPPLSPRDQSQLDNLRQGTFDKVLKPGVSTGTDPTQATTERNEPKWRRVIDHAMDVARQQGRLPGSLERLFGDIVAPPVDWTEILQTTLARAFTGDRWAFDVPEQEWMARDIYVPTRSGFGARDIVVGGDVSGSVSDEEIALCKAKIGEILEQIKPRRLFVLWCDTRITRVDELSDASELHDLPAPTGGGGTDFRPIFRWVEEHDLELDGLVYITDLEGTYPSTKPNYPVVWASVCEPRTQVPFGQVVKVPRFGIPRGRY